MHSDPNSQWQLRGPSCLDDAALLSFLLTRGGAPGPQTFALAGRVLNAAQGLAGLTQAREGELCAVPGIGPSRARRLMALVELSRRMSEQPIRRGEPCVAPDQVYRMVRGRLRDQRQESFWILMLDTRARPLELLEVARGGRNTVSVGPAEVFEPALRAGAAQLVLIHNHPSGDPEPSPLDRLMTKRLEAAGELMGITVVDHVIIGRSRYSSMAERGLMQGNEADFRPGPAGTPCFAGEVRAVDFNGRRAPRPIQERARPSVETQLSLAFERERTAWQLPEQLPLPYLLQGRLPFASCDASSPTEADTDPGSWGAVSDAG